MQKLRYGYGTTMHGVGFEDAIEKVTEALANEGFGVLSEIDVKATLKRKLDADFRPYRILGACNPELAQRALQAEPHIGLLLPCNVVVQQGNGGVDVSVADPRAMFQMVDNADVGPVADEADHRLRRVIDALK